MTEETAVRIATALERIANALDRAHPARRTPGTPGAGGAGDALSAEQTRYGPGVRRSGGR